MGKLISFQVEVQTLCPIKVTTLHCQYKFTLLFINFKFKAFLFLNKSFIVKYLEEIFVKKQTKKNKKTQLAIFPYTQCSY